MSKCVLSFLFAELRFLSPHLRVFWEIAQQSSCSMIKWVRSESGCLSHNMGKHFISWGPPSQAERPSEGTSTGPTSTNLNAVSRILGHAKEGLPPPPWGQQMSPPWLPSSPTQRTQAF